MWIVISILMLVLLGGVGWWRQSAGQRKLLAILRYCFDCFCLSNRMMNASESSRKAAMLWKACGEMAAIYTRLLPRIATVRAASIKRLADDAMNGALNDSFAHLLSASVDWLANVPLAVRIRTCHRVFGPSADQFVHALARLHEDTNQIAKDDLAEMGFGHLAA